MKNKIYILCATKTKLFLYNVMKLKKIADFQITNFCSFEKMTEILDRYDLTTLKTWFTIDIKLGVITITFNIDNLFANNFNFDPEFIEKVIERTNSFTKLANIEFKFATEVVSSPAISLLSQTSNMRNTDKNEKSHLYSSTMPFSSKKNIQSFYDKSNSSGFYLMKLLFNNYSTKIANNYLTFYDTYFWDTRDYLTGELVKLGKVGKSNNTSSLNIFIFSTFENQIFVGPYFDDVGESLKMPTFLKEVLQIVSLICIIF
jgi:hypothetical protein